MTVPSVEVPIHSEESVEYMIEARKQHAPSQPQCLNRSIIPSDRVRLSQPAECEVRLSACPGLRIWSLECACIVSLDGRLSPGKNGCVATFPLYTAFSASPQRFEPNAAPLVIVRYSALACRPRRLSFDPGYAINVLTIELRLGTQSIKSTSQQRGGRHAGTRTASAGPGRGVE